MDQQPPEPPQNKPKWLTRKEYTDPAEKKKDFWRGFWLWWGLNILMGVLSTGLFILAADYMYSDDTVISLIANIANIVAGLVPWVINLGLIIYFAITRSQIALGMLVAFGVSFAIVVVLGIIFLVTCFVLLANYQ